MSDVAAVVGASGYAGGELLRLLGSHPALSIGPIFGASSAGQPLGSVHRHLPGLSDLIIGDVAEVVNAPDQALADVDVVFLALPHGHSADVARAIAASRLGDNVVIVDLGADHRLIDANDWARYYGPDSAAHAGAWVYGLPELPGAREAIGRATQIANPGCYPTAVAVALAPLLAAGVARPADVVVVAASGTSGAGRSASINLSGSEVMGSLAGYKAGGVHQHTPEMAQTLSIVAKVRVPVSFTPVLAPMPRGILATSSGPAVDGVTTEQVRSALVSAYADEPFVTVLPEGSWPRTADVVGSNSVHVQAAMDEEAGRVVVLSAIDNLVKGAAGQAIQNANIALGVAESSGLSADGVAP
ncbi:MAG TPA: N-acetyl-gamma-glutamyl-phosphate reductase [Actinomycetes bacterium]|nr:N-acetyl-gamma-glutamyl-phosphate reductase [Actinomycetes bacterium]